MSEAPKKIWFDLDDCTASPVPLWDDEVPYVRADLVDELVEALEDLIGLVRAENDGELLTIQEARVALSKAKGESNE